MELPNDILQIIYLELPLNYLILINKRFYHIYSNYYYKLYILKHYPNLNIKIIIIYK